MPVLIHKATRRVCEVAPAPFPVHEDFEWADYPAITRRNIGMKRDTDGTLTPPEEVQLANSRRAAE